MIQLRCPLSICNSIENANWCQEVFLQYMWLSNWIIALVTPILFLTWTFCLANVKPKIKWTEMQSIKVTPIYFPYNHKGSKLRRGGHQLIHRGPHTQTDRALGNVMCRQSSVGSFTKWRPWPCDNSVSSAQGPSGRWESGAQSVLGSLSTRGFGEANKESFPQETPQAQEGQPSLLRPFFILHKGVWTCILPTEHLASK